MWSAAVAQQKEVVQQKEQARVVLFDHTEKQKEDRERLLRGERLTAGEKRRRKRKRKRVQTDTSQALTWAKRDLSSLESTVGILEGAISLRAILSEDDRSLLV